MSETRTYKSPLREEQMAQTRDKILDKVVEILATPDIELTVAEAANRARVAVRTAYRYFPTKDALLDAFNARASEQFGFVAFPKSLDELPAYAVTLARTFAANESVLRAGQRTLGADEVRRRRKTHQARACSKLVEEGAPHVDPAIRQFAAAAVMNAVGFDSWLQLRDLWQLTPEQCEATVHWNVTAILAHLHKSARRR